VYECFGFADYEASWSGIGEIELAAGLDTSVELIGDWHSAVHMKKAP